MDDAFPLERQNGTADLNALAKCETITELKNFVLLRDRQMFVYFERLLGGPHMCMEYLQWRGSFLGAAFVQLLNLLETGR